MKRLLLIALVGLVSVGFIQSQTKPYRVVFDLTSRDTLDQKAVLRWIREVSTSSPKAQMEVVMYAKGFELVMPERTIPQGIGMADLHDPRALPSGSLEPSPRDL